MGGPSAGGVLPEGLEPLLATRRLLRDRGTSSIGGRACRNLFRLRRRGVRANGGGLLRPRRLWLHRGIAIRLKAQAVPLALPRGPLEQCDGAPCIQPASAVPLEGGIRKGHEVDVAPRHCGIHHHPKADVVADQLEFLPAPQPREAQEGAHVLQAHPGPRPRTHRRGDGAQDLLPPIEGGAGQGGSGRQGAAERQDETGQKGPRAKTHVTPPRRSPRRRPRGEPGESVSRPGPKGAPCRRTAHSIYRAATATPPKFRVGRPDQRPPQKRAQGRKSSSTRRPATPVASPARP